MNALRFIIGIVALVYLLNLTFGIIEILPDNLPIIGNLDEGAAAIIVDGCLLGGAGSRTVKAILGKK